MRFASRRRVLILLVFAVAEAVRADPWSIMSKPEAERIAHALNRVDHLLYFCSDCYPGYVWVIDIDSIEVRQLPFNRDRWSVYVGGEVVLVAFGKDRSETRDGILRLGLRDVVCRSPMRNNPDNAEYWEHSLDLRYTFIRPGDFSRWNALGRGVASHDSYPPEPTTVRRSDPVPYSWVWFSATEVRLIESCIRSFGAEKSGANAFGHEQ